MSAEAGRGLAFADTNVFVYQYDPLATDKRETALALVEALITSEALVASFQVARETISALRSTRKGRTAMSEARAWQIVGTTILPHIRHIETAEDHERAHALRERYGVSVYDSFILASALRAGCRTLYSEDFAHGTDYDGLTVVDPFRDPA